MKKILNKILISRKGVSFRFLILLVAFSLYGCNKIIEIPPPGTELVSSNVYMSDATAIAAVTGILTDITKDGNYGGPFAGPMGISLLAGLSADELLLSNEVNNLVLQQYYQNNLSVISAASTGGELWTYLFNLIFRANSVIEGVTSNAAVATITPSVREHLLGEAQFLRAFFYFYLVNFYEDAPILLSTDFKVNSAAARNTKAEVFQQIITDLQESQIHLSATYLGATLIEPSSERVRPTKWAARSLLAKAYLATGSYADAEAEASLVIDESATFTLTDLSSVFLKNSAEAIWQIQPTAVLFNTQDAPVFVIPPTGLSDLNPVYLNGALINSFEVGDQRAVPGNWVNTITIDGSIYFFPYKYKKNEPDPEILDASGQEEYLMMIRLADVYLVRAEARAQQDNITGSQEDLNRIRFRAGLLETTAVDKQSLLDAILHERQTELFVELGTRWIDLKRTGVINSVMEVITPLKAAGNPWRPFQQLYPLPLSDIQLSSALEQNPGY